MRIPVPTFACLLPAVLAAQAPDLPDRGLCAHRGAMATHPENTLPAFAEALRLGAAMVEFDVRSTRDRALVVLHDATVDRTTDGSGPVAGLTLAEVRRLDAGAWKAPRFAGTRVPLLREALRMMPRGVWLNVHLKGGPELGAACARMLRDEGRLDQAFLACGSEAAAGARGAVPGIQLGNMDRGPSTAAYVDATVAVPGRYRFLQLRRVAEMPTDELSVLVARLRSAGVRVAAYGGGDDPEVLARWLRAGIGFPLVDDLGAAVQTAQRMGLAQRIGPMQRVGPAQRAAAAATGPRPRVFDVRDFGASGDGSADDTPAIQRAVDAAAAAGGGRVAFPPGTYTVRDTVHVHGSGIELWGLALGGDGPPSPTATLRLADGAHGPGDNLHLVHVHGTQETPLRDVAIRGLVLDANFWQQPGAHRPRGLQVEHATGVRIEDVRIERPWVGLTFGRGASGTARRVVVSSFHDDGFSATGDAVDGGTVGVRFEDCVARDARSGTNGGPAGARDSGFEIEDGARDVRLDGCVVRGADGTAFTIRNHARDREDLVTTPLRTRGITLSRCVSVDAGADALEVFGRDGDNTVSDVRVIGCALDGAVAIHGGADDVVLERCAVAGDVSVGLRGPAVGAVRIVASHVAGRLRALLPVGAPRATLRVEDCHIAGGTETGGDLRRLQRR